jgi:CheY-like chemotaxis protein/DNA-binding transcriptional regulator YhcF (GntR family)
MLDRLSKCGLTEIQTKVYYHLIRHGKTSATIIAKELGVHRSEIYRVLRELAQKGIVTELKGRPILFTCKPPEETLDILLGERVKELEYQKESMPKLVEWLNSQSKSKKIRPSVLLIDDDKSLRESLSHVLKENGFEVDIAGDGDQALKKSRQRLYNVAIIDIRLPDIEGTKLLKILKEENSQIKEMIITGYPSIENAIQAVNEGADAYMLKPFNPSDLIAKMKEKLLET